MFDLLGGKRRKKLESEVERLKLAIQHFEFDPSTGIDSNSPSVYRGNTYIGDVDMIAAVDKAYNGRSDWGVNLVKAVVEIRAAMIGGAGIEVGLTEGFKGDADKELKFIKEFMDYNSFDPETQVSWAVEGGIEGRALFMLESRQDKIDGKPVKAIKSTFIPKRSGSNAGSYDVKTNPLDYSDLTLVEVRPANGAPPRFLKPGEFVYKKFGGRVSQVNCSTPIVGHVMPQIEAIDHALRDWREINNLYAQPTPTVECVNAADAETQYTLMTDVIKWKIGHLLVVGGGTFKMVGPEIDGVVSLLDEVTMNLKMVSGTTGIPPHFLGFPDLMQNRATADSLTEVMFAATARERLAWISLYTDMFRKAIELNNKTNGTSMNPKAVTALLPENAQTRLRQLVDIWLPVYEAKALTRKSFLNRVPGIDAEKESGEVMKAIQAGEYDGVKPMEGNGQLGTRKPGKGSPDPDNTRTKTQLEKRTGGAGRNAK